MAKVNFDDKVNLKAHGPIHVNELRAEDVNELKKAANDNNIAIINKVDKVVGKGLSTNDFTITDKKGVVASIKKNPAGSETKFFNEKGDAVEVEKREVSDDLTSGGADTALNLDGAKNLKRLIDNINFLDENVPVVMVDTNDPDTIPNTMRFTFKGGQTMDVDIKVLMGSGVLKEVTKANGYTLNFKTYSGLNIPVDLSSWFAGVMKNSAIERDSGKDVEIVCGVIRNSGGVWGFIKDSEHLGTSGFLRVETKPKYARVYYKSNYGKILTLLAAPDETYVQNGVSCGASVGTTYANIFLQQDVKLGDYIFYNGTNFISYDGSYNNISYSAGALTVEHTQKAFGYNISVIGRDVCNYHLRLGSVGENSIEIKFYNMDGTQYTGVPNTDMKIFVSRNSDTELNNVTSAIQGSNVWIIGIMQKN